MINFWAQKHIEQDIGWLSNSPADKALKNTGLFEKIPEGSKLLEVGVSTGRESEGLKEMGFELYGMDICPQAFLHTAHIFKDWYINYLPEDKFDFALANFVVQHMSNETLEKHLKEVLKSLKFGGIYGFNYLIRKDNEEFDESIASQEVGHVKRTEQEMINLIKSIGGKAIPIKSGIMHMEK